MTKHTDTSRSDDLVERLRQVQSIGPNSAGLCTNWLRNPDGPEAADRIEALEAENERLGVVIGDNARFVCKILDEQDAKIERLRAYVSKAETTFRWYGDLHAAKPDPDKAKRNYDLADEARAALGEKQ